MSNSLSKSCKGSNIGSQGLNSQSRTTNTTKEDSNKPTCLTSTAQYPSLDYMGAAIYPRSSKVMSRIGKAVKGLIKAILL